MDMGGPHWRRQDIQSVTLEFLDGDVLTFSEEDVRVGHVSKSVHSDSVFAKDPQEWDSFDVHISGQRGPLTRGKG